MASTPGWALGYVPPPLEWNALWASKADDTVTATGGATHTLADWFQGIDKTGAGGTSFNYNQVFSTTVVPSLYAHGSVSGTVTSGNAFFRNFSIDSDTVDASLAAGGGAIVNYFGHTLSAGAVGGRTTHEIFMNIAGATTAGAFYYVAGAAMAQASASAGGLTGAGNARGNLFAFNDVVQLLTGAGLYWNEIVGHEIDISVQTGVGVSRKEGLKVVQLSGDAVNGITADYAYGLGNQAGGTAPGWNLGFAFGSPEAWWPIKSTGTMIGTYASSIGGGPAMTAANGIDFSAVTFTNKFLIGPSSAFTVDNAGAVMAGNSVTINGLTAANRLFSFTTSGSLRWQTGAAATSENYDLYRYDSSGVFQATTLSFARANGAATFESTIQATGYRVGANQVIGARDTGWTAMTGTPDKATAYATSTVTLAQLAGRVDQLQTALTTHGLIGP